MKLSNDNEFVTQSVDIMERIEELQSKYRTVYWTHIQGQIYIYKPLGRRDYKEISDSEMHDIDKEDEVCKRCLLFPEEKEIDFDNCEAGFVTQLFKKIMENSFLDDINKRVVIMDLFRSEMYDFQNQVTCIINEAFPQFDIEEIENWDIERTAKYLSRAEWKLQNFRGATFNHEMLDQMQQQENGQEQTAPEQSKQKVDSDKMSKSEAPKKKKLDPTELARLKSIAPEINWEADTILTQGMDGMVDGMDTLSPALRPGF